MPMLAASIKCDPATGDLFDDKAEFLPGPALYPGPQDVIARKTHVENELGLA
jgi:hypothetical protein